MSEKQFEIQNEQHMTINMKETEASTTSVHETHPASAFAEATQTSYVGLAVDGLSKDELLSRINQHSATMTSLAQRAGSVTSGRELTKLYREIATEGLNVLQLINAHGDVHGELEELQRKCVALFINIPKPTAQQDAQEYESYRQAAVRQISVLAGLPSGRHLLTTLVQLRNTPGTDGHGMSMTLRFPVGKEYGMSMNEPHNINMHMIDAATWDEETRKLIQGSQGVSAEVTVPMLENGSVYADALRAVDGNPAIAEHMNTIITAHEMIHGIHHMFGLAMTHPTKEVREQLATGHRSLSDFAEEEYITIGSTTLDGTPANIKAQQLLGENPFFMDLKEAYAVSEASIREDLGLYRREDHSHLVSVSEIGRGVTAEEFIALNLAEQVTGEFLSGMGLSCIHIYPGSPILTEKEFNDLYDSELAADSFLMRAVRGSYRNAPDDIREQLDRVLTEKAPTIVGAMRKTVYEAVVKLQKNAM